MKIKRVYDKPEKSDGRRVLVDRLWPRGVGKRAAKIDAWAKDLAPSNVLRAWFHKDPQGRFAEFQKRYRQELKGKRESAEEILSKTGPVTLVTAVKEISRSHIPSLVKFLRRML